MTDKERIAELVRTVTLAAAELAFLGLIVRFVVLTWQAKTGAPPDLPSVQVNAAAGLAVVLGGGYALLLGVPSKPAQEGLLETVRKVIVGERTLLFAGVILYMLAGLAVCLTYGLNEAETPAVMKTIAVAFSGYVVAYIGTAYQRLN